MMPCGLPIRTGTERTTAIPAAGRTGLPLAVGRSGTACPGSQGWSRHQISPADGRDRSSVNSVRPSEVPAATRSTLAARQDGHAPADWEWQISLTLPRLTRSLRGVAPCDPVRGWLDLMPRGIAGGCWRAVCPAAAQPGVQVSRIRAPTTHPIRQTRTPCRLDRRFVTSFSPRGGRLAVKFAGPFAVASVANARCYRPHRRPVTCPGEFT